MKVNADLLYREKRTYAGGIVEMVVWCVSEPVPPSEHPFNPNSSLEKCASQNQGVVGRVLTRHVGLKPDLRCNGLSEFKYRLVFVRDGKRLVGYDNERGKGDHRHLGTTELLYLFVDETRLLEDFWRDVMEASK